MMWQTVNVAGASLIGVAMGALFGRNTLVLIVSPIVFGLAEAGLIWAAAFLTDRITGWGVLGQPILLVPVMVGYITGLGLSVVLLAQHRKSRTPAFWLPETETRGGEANWRARHWATEPSLRRNPARPDPIMQIALVAAPPPQPATPETQAPAAPPVQPHPNKRRNARRRAVLAGKLVLAQGVETRCTIRDLSQSGARVRLASSQPTPNVVTLIDLSNGIVHQAEVVWRSSSDLGLRFTASTLQRG